MFFLFLVHTGVHQYIWDLPIPIIFPYLIHKSKYSIHSLFRSTFFFWHLYHISYHLIYCINNVQHLLSCDVAIMIKVIKAEGPYLKTKRKREAIGLVINQMSLLNKQISSCKNLLHVWPSCLLL